MMPSLHRSPQVEEGVRNIILQNRCGNRLTLLLHDDRTELEFLYKPNAFRRKDLRARTFSTRDNCTFVFRAAALPEVGAGMVTEFDYDPFATRIGIAASAQARNTLAFVNVADENVFAISARAPLALALRPHAAFTVRDGLLTESFRDRGEDIVSFVAFPGYELNRYRVLDDGTHVLQLMENDVILLGAEENEAQVERVVRSLGRCALEELIARNERLLAPALGNGMPATPGDPPLQRVLEINRRATWSAFDAGGASFGALCRIYMLTWLRDASMASACFARAGMPDMIKLWAPFVLANPSERLDTATGATVREHMQLIGTRWNKPEDDGVYYAALSLFFLVECTGDTAALQCGLFDELLATLDRAIESRFDADVGLFGSDTLGEDLLASSPCYGYDPVNGTVKPSHHAPSGGRAVMRAWSLYQNMNMYNALRMASSLIGTSGRAELAGQAGRYRALAARHEAALRTAFVGEDGEYRSVRLLFTDGAVEWRAYGRGVDYWEHAWAVTTGPFLPDPAVSVNSARAIIRRWPEIRAYGYCPWNYLAAFLHEHGLDSASFRALLDEQVTDALRLTTKYPMQGTVTEYQTNHEGWRALPFGAGSLMLAVASRLLSVRAHGLAVRANCVLRGLTRFVWRDAVIDATAEGDGDAVDRIMLNGTPLDHSLVIPRARLRFGRNRLTVRCAARSELFRLYDTDAELVEIEESPGGISYVLSGDYAIQAIWDNAGGVLFTVTDVAGGEPVEHAAEPLSDTGRTVVRIPRGGTVRITASGGRAASRKATGGRGS